MVRTVRGRWMLVQITTVALVVTIVMAGSANAGPLDGRIVYSDAFGGSGVYTVAPDGTARIHLIGDTNASRPRWRPDGSGVSFIVDIFGPSVTSRLEIVDPMGADRKVLLARSKLPTHFKVISTYDWSPDGTKLVLCLVNFSGQAPVARTYVSNPNGSRMLLALKDACGEDWGSQDRILAYEGSKLFALDPDGRHVVRVRTGVKTWDAQWSPDGTRIVFMCGPQQAADICVSNANGSNLENLTASDRSDWSPSWSPDGSRIVWAPATNTSHQFAELWRMRTDGSSKTRLTDTPRIDEYDPDWSAAS
jgi:Tol biopolymer transport system component